jgi:putative pyruvate formate lyase activating enzyme
MVMKSPRELTVSQKRHLAGVYEAMNPCALCPRGCRVRRLAGERGFCGLGESMMISSYGPHFGEERVLVGRGGSGTIFLTGCNLGCLFCQNYDISILRRGRETPVERVVGIMLELEADGCENVNFVTPTPQAPMVLEAIMRARAAGLAVPIVYNCGGYEPLEVLRALEGYVEIYMPDVKSLDRDLAKRLMRAEDYPDVVRSAVREMQRQVGDLQIVCGVATRGLLVRQLVMPGAVEDSRRVIDFLADDVSANTFVNVMAQYHPAHRAAEVPQIARRTTNDEWREVYDYARQRGLRLAD